MKFSSRKNNKLKRLKRSAATTSGEKWWKYYSTNEVVAIDCEFVIKENAHRKFTNELATVAVCNFNGETIYEGMVKWIPFTLKVNPHTKKANTFTEYSLVNGEQFESVREEVMEAIENKLIIVCGGEGDFRALKLPLGDYDVHDIQTYFQSLGKPDIR